jgi:hypothetical protein
VLRPAYGERSFDLLPGTIERLLTGSTSRAALDPALLGGLDGPAERVLFVYFDAFGWCFAEQHLDHPLLRRAASDGVLEQLTSQFPSTTTAHVTTIHSGLPVWEHGLYEWYVLDPGLNRLVAPLHYVFAGTREPLPLDPAELFPAGELYADLAAAGVPATVVQSHVFATSAPNTRLAASATVVPSHGVAHGLAAAGAALAEPGYAFVYLDHFDGLMHHVGPEAPIVHSSARATLDLIDRALQDGTIPAGTRVLLSADHGMSPIDPATTLYVNRSWPELMGLLERGADGRPLAPAGSSRDLFLHALPDAVDQVVDGLAERLDGRAQVRRVADLIADGTFGPRQSAALLSRLANVVVLPEVGESAYWHDPPRFEEHLLGQHGGLSARELEIPLLVLDT